MTDKIRIQIIGWLLLVLSLLFLGSMISYDLSEEPSLIAQNINNPFNIFGVYIGFYFMKLGFGYAALFFPISLATVAYYLITNFSIDVFKLVRYQIIFLIISSMVLGFIENFDSIIVLEKIDDYNYSGLLGGLSLGLIYDWTGLFGSILILFSSIMISIISFFRIDTYSYLKMVPQFFKKIISNINFDIKSFLPAIKKQDKHQEKDRIIKDESFLEDINTDDEEEIEKQVLDGVNDRQEDSINNKHENQIEYDIPALSEDDVDQKDEIFRNFNRKSNN